MACEDECRTDHTVEPGGKPIHHLFAVVTMSLERHQNILIAKFIERYRQVRISSHLLILVSGHVVTSFQGSEQLDRQRGQGLDCGYRGIERPVAWCSIAFGSAPSAC